MSISKKVKIYAIFQFITFVSYFILGIAFILLANSIQEWQHLINDKSNFIAQILILIFSMKIPGVFGITSSILIYIFMFFTISSWIIGLQVVRSRNRNLLDSLFLLFAFIPLVSNILCLIAQVSSNTIAISYNIDRQEEFKIQYAKAATNKEAMLKELKKQVHKLIK